MTTEHSLSFDGFGLSAPVLSALARKGFTAPSSIQALALPRLLADEGHLIAKARTGTGKTAAFGIPLVERLNAPVPHIRALILTPTRELALQVSQEIRSLAGGPFPRVTAVYGGSSMGVQLRELSRGVDIVVGTPGRVMDHLERGSLKLEKLEWFILDEADEMLDMGFLEDVETIIAKSNPDRRVALFSATMPPPILRIVREHIGEVEIIEDKASAEEKPAVDQFHLVLRREDRLEALRRIVDSSDEFYGLIFCATKVESDELSRRLVENGYSAEAIHGDLSQEARERTLRRFRKRLTTILVATDVAARGIDVAHLTHVINWDLPNDRESYVHRIGRTGRAGRRGIAISFVLPAGRGRITLLSRSMEKVLGSPIKLMKVPSVEFVMDKVRARVLREALEAAPGSVESIESASSLSQDDATVKPALVDLDASADSPEAVPAASADVSLEAPASFGPDDQRAVLALELLNKLGPQRALEALISHSYGNVLDASRYAPIEEVREIKPRDDRFARGTSGRYGPRGEPFTRHASGRQFERRGTGKQGERQASDRHFERHAPVAVASGGDSASERVYVALGRHHGAGPREIASLVGRAAGVPGRFIDAIDVRDYCAFATVPRDAARRAFAFARNQADHPAIRPAAPAGEKRPQDRD